MKYYFIINPNSGKIDTNQFEQRILKECSKEKIKYKIFIDKRNNVSIIIDERSKKVKVKEVIKKWV